MYTDKEIALTPATRKLWDKKQDPFRHVCTTDDLIRKQFFKRTGDQDNG